MRSSAASASGAAEGATRTTRPSPTLGSGAACRSALPPSAPPAGGTDTPGLQGRSWRASPAGPGPRTRLPTAAAPPTDPTEPRIRRLHGRRCTPTWRQQPGEPASGSGPQRAAGMPWGQRWHRSRGRGCRGTARSAADWGGLARRERRNQPDHLSRLETAETTQNHLAASTRGEPTPQQHQAAQAGSSRSMRPGRRCAARSPAHGIGSAGAAAMGKPSAPAPASPPRAWRVIRRRDLGICSGRAGISVPNRLVRSGAHRDCRWAATIAIAVPWDGRAALWWRG